MRRIGSSGGIVCITLKALVAGLTLAAAQDLAAQALAAASAAGVRDLARRFAQETSR